ncbi:EutN/CcmL family microcompartment protein [candidate division KSB1 bacterium]|nr:EutN/CcmL family microcompartment protein [candidate division KSB1 bacterium]
MELARVEGTVVSTVKADRLKGYKLLVIHLLKPDTTPTGSHVVAVDTVGAGNGEIVIAVRGSSARQTADLSNVPTDTSIVAIVDSIEYQGKIVFRKTPLKDKSDEIRTN